MEELIQKKMEEIQARAQSTPSSQDSPGTSTMQTETTSPNPDFPVYKCPKCKDMGLYEPEWGKGWVQCECQKIRIAERRIKNSGLEKEIAEKTFKNFRAETDWQRQLKETAIAYGEAYFEAKKTGGKMPWFFVSGEPGSGKTHICTALCGAFLKREVSVIYMQWVTDSRRLRALVNDADEFDAEIQPYIDVDVLYIDDLFKQPSHSELRATDAEGKVIFEILNRRMMQNKATIISTEWYLEDELMAFDSGTFSRAYMLAKGFTVSIERGMDKNYRLNGGKNTDGQQ